MSYAKGQYKQEKSEIKKGIKAIWRHIRPFKSRLVLLAALGIISSISNGFVPYITGRFFDTLIAVSQNRIETGWADLPVWALFLGIWAIIQLVANNIDWVMDRLRRQVDTKVHLGIQAEGFLHLFHLPLDFHRSAHINGALQKISQAGWRTSGIIRTVIQFAPQFLSILIGITLAATINTMLAGVLFLGVLLYLVILVKILLPIAQIDSAAHRAWNDSWNDGAAAVHQIDSVKQAATEGYESKKITNAFMNATYNLWLKLENRWSDMHFFQRAIVFLTQITVFIISVQLIKDGLISVGELVALNGYALMFFGPFVSLGFSWQTIQNGITAAAQAEDIFNQKREEYQPTAMTKIGRLKGEIIFDKVFFKYGEGQPEVLKGLDFEVEAGKIVALVGESGVGKSTAISLVSGYHFPSEGRVLIDGVSTRNLDLHNLRKQIAVVPQEIALFNDTIETNIRYGSFNVSEEEVRRAAKEVRLDEFISTLPDGYKALVGERGIKLSVGQKQRVSIARAILRNPAILILDEPTSALDAETEKIVTEALEKLMTGKTTFIIAHRLSTVRKADKILVFKKGQIVETGRHEDLIKKDGGVYRHLYEYQIGLH